MRQLTMSDVTFTVTPEEEYTSLEHAFEDNEQRLYVLGELARGNAWGYCCVRVTAAWGSHSSSEYLGRCSYASEKEFMTDCGIFDQMKQAALNGLNASISSVWAELQSLIV